jgi:hypothetical protein
VQKSYMRIAYNISERGKCMSFLKKTAATITGTAATMGFYAGQAFAGFDGVNETTVFNGKVASNPIYAKGVKIIEIVGGIGGIAFTLAVMIITLFIIFGSVSPQKRGGYWIGLISCVAGAFVFFGAFGFADGIMSLATAGSKG